MKDNPEFLFIIPARGGSKGIPRKNILPLHEKPLINYTIEAALNTPVEKRVIVSTDDPEIALVARHAGADVPFLRPIRLAGDESSIHDAIDHLLETLALQDYHPDYIVLLQPTSPLRNTNDINAAISTVVKQDCDAVYSVCEVKEHPLIMKKIDHCGRLQNLMEITEGIVNRQSFPSVYRLNGAIYIVRAAAWHLYHSFSAIKDVCAYVMPIERSVDIDTIADWKLAESLMK